jgi:hypothetical protein
MPVSVTGVVGIEAVIAPGRIIPVDGLLISILPFNYELAGKRQQFSGALNQAMTDDATNYLFLDFDGSLNVNTTGYPTTTHVRLGRIVTASGLIIAQYDDRIVMSTNLDRELNKEVENAQSSTTGTWQQKIRLSLTDIPEGTYIVQWYCELRHSNNTLGEAAQMRVEADDLTELGTSAWPYNVWEDGGGFTIADLAAGNHTLDLDFQAVGGGTAYVRRARLLLWRIA